MNSRSCFHKTALALVALTLVVSGAAWGQLGAEAYANDGARQTAQGGWLIPYDYCGLDASELGVYTTEAACVAAGWNWGPKAYPGTGEGCFYNRYECNGRLFYGVNQSGGANLETPDGSGGFLYDNATECAAPEREWRSSGTCDDAGYRNESDCETAGHTWYSPACRGLFLWDASYGFVGSGTGQYAECTKCHNDRHYPKSKPGHEYHGGERSVGETYVMTGHKNMQRPAAPDALDPHYLPGAPWLDKTGTVVATDTSFFPIDWATGTITTTGGVKDLYLIYDWMADQPRSFKDGDSYSCARCHSTGYEATAADETKKQPYLMFGDADPGTGTTTGTWDQFGIQCSRCHGSRPYSATSANRHHPTDLSTGANRVALCMDCHRQETSSLPYDGGATPATGIKVGSSHGHLGFVSHYTGNQVLNSPHAKFSGTSAEIADETKYASHFTYYGWNAEEGEVEHTTNGGGCTTCHDVHKSSLEAANPEGGFIHGECSECHPKNLAAMLHPGGKDTPLELMGTNPDAACESCHMPEGDHFFRISVDAGYSTFPQSIMNATATPVQNANTAPDADGYPAVWVDLDKACGQCHGGGTEYKLTSGTMAANSGVVTVADPAGFVKGQQVSIAGAGAAGAELHGYIAEVAGNDVTLVLAKSVGAVTDAEVQLNPPAEGIGYISKANLAAYAKGIHNDVPKVGFTYTLGSPNTLQVSFNASATVCSMGCDGYAWDFGDGTTGTGVSPSHTYAAPGATYNVTLTVTDYGAQEGEKTKVVTTYTPDLPPTAAGVCTFDANTWSLSVDDNSTDDLGVKQVAITWGDGSLTTTGAAGAVFPHTFTKAGTFTVTVKVVDTKGQQAQYVCAPAPTAAYFQVAGKVTKAGGAVALSNAKVQLFKGATLVKTVYTNISGDYVAGGLKPGTYTLVVTRTGYTFTSPAPVTVGPSAAGVNVSAN